MRCRRSPTEASSQASAAAGTIGGSLRHRQDRRDRDRRADALDPGDRRADRRTPSRSSATRANVTQTADGEVDEARRGGAEDRPRGRSHPCDRRADQPAGAQRDDRGGARRRVRPRLRGRRRRGQGAGDARPAKATDEIAQQVGGIQASTQGLRRCDRRRSPARWARSATSRPRSPPRSNSRAQPRRRFRATSTMAAQGTEELSHERRRP